MTARHFFMVCLLTLYLSTSGCAPEQVIPKEDKYGCTPPPTGVFTSAGVDISFAEIAYRDIAVRNLNLETNPKIISLANEYAQNNFVRDYMRCLAKNRDGLNDVKSKSLG
jgi:hypothetical protein